MDTPSCAKILEQRSHIVPGKIRITEYVFEAPRDHSKPEAGRIRLFGRGATKTEKPAAPEADPKPKQPPWLVYLQGGPGFECRSPHYYPFVHMMLDRGYEVLCLDQRGTGRSGAVAASTLGLRGDDPVQARYLASFRADSIVRDCELVRALLTADYPPEKKKWTVLGQSFGGFVITSYLSMYPDGLREAFVLGGLPPISVDAPDEVYRRLYRKVIEKNDIYYNKYPEDVDRVKRVVGLLRRFGDSTVRLPSEASLSARRFQQLGIMLGFHGGVDSLHDIVSRASSDLDQFGHLTRPTLSAIESSLPYDDHLIYSMLHEPIYCQGAASNWSAHRVRQDYPEFALDTQGPVYFTGEMIYPWMFDDYAELRKVKGPAQMLAEHSDWPALYDKAQLARNEVPVYAAVYVDDMYVDYDFSLETARSIKGCKIFITNMMYHDALRSRTEEVLRSLMFLRDDCMD
ncbi:Alpha/Beta hydrolase protein [Lineolata rhizophorae]|uniref:Alpha/Beta hydrolase protein n=1 Tax=Lineolata rhizophorae TaxID=578093 RepID=A0A6A6P781_9PEZI|nr:Alpha/Beta hydrolase protein [Lineolata rhizophorae]